MPSYLQLDGIWSWHSTPRAAYSETAGTAGRTFFAFVDDNTSGVWVAQYDHATQQTTSFRLATSFDIGGDDHDNPSLLVLANGKILCTWTGHPGSSIQARTSTSAGDISAFDAAVTITDTGYTLYEYCSLAQLSADNSGRVYVYYCVHDAGDTYRLWHRRHSDDSGASWGVAGAFTVIYDPASSGKTPYLEFSSNGVDRIDITMQPTQVAAGVALGVYHFYHKYDSGSTKYFKSDGTEITGSLPFSSQTSFTTIDSGSGYASGTKNWLCYHNNGFPIATYAAMTDNPITAHNYKQARWNGSAWVNTGVNIASGGSSTNYLVAAGQPQVYYSGGIAVNPANVNEVLLSRNNGNFEIERWATADSGATWSKAADVTTGGSTKRARPAYVRGTNPPLTAIYWAGTSGVAQGGYTTFNNYRADLYAIPIATVNSLIAKDTFSRMASGTTLENAAYNLEAGRQWDLVTGTAPKVSTTGTIYAGTTAATIVNNYGVPRSADYRVACDIVLKTKVASDLCGLEVRQQAAGPGGTTDTGYLIVADTSLNQVRLIRRNAAVSTALQSPAVTLTGGVTYNLAVEITGTGATVTIKVYWDGALLVTHSDTDAGRITTAGLAGIRTGHSTIPTDTTGMHLDNFVAYDLATTYTLTGPSGGVTGEASSAFTLFPNGWLTGTVITPSDGGAGGTFTPASRTFTNTTEALTFTYTPASTGTKTISATNDTGLTNPSNLSYVVTSPGVPAGGFGLIGPGLCS